MQLRQKGASPLSSRISHPELHETDTFLTPRREEREVDVHNRATHTEATDSEATSMKLLDTPSTRSRLENIDGFDDTTPCLTPPLMDRV